MQDLLQLPNETAIGSLLPDEEPMAKKPNSDYATLKKQRDELNAKMEELSAEARDDFRQRTIEEATELEVDIATFFAPAKKARGGKGVSSLPPKYIGPDGELYSGKGRQAGWLAKLVEQGKDADDYLNPAWKKAKGL